MPEQKMLSEFIAELQEVMEENGDLPVYIHDYNKTGSERPPRAVLGLISKFYIEETKSQAPWMWNSMVQRPLGISNDGAIITETMAAVNIFPQRN